MCDAFPDMRDLIPLPDKTAAEAQLALRTFVGRTKVERFFSDRSLELKKAAKDLKWVHDKATPHRPESHGLIEVKVGHTKQATRCNPTDGTPNPDLREGIFRIINMRKGNRI